MERSDHTSVALIALNTAPEAEQIKTMPTFKSTLQLTTLATLLYSVQVMAACPQHLTVAQSKSPLTLEQATCLENQVTVSQLLQGGSPTVYWAGNIARHMPTAVVPHRQPSLPLANEPMPQIGETTAASALGTLSLNDFLEDPRSGARGFIVIHRGRVVFEQYPGMRDSDNHLWASNAKPMASLLVDLLIDDGKLDPNKAVTEYLQDFRGTAWDSVQLIDLLDMTPGLDTEETSETRKDPNSIAIRTFLAEMGAPHGQQLEHLRDVLKQAKRVREPGTQFEYGSPVTQALVLVTEAAAQQRWADLFDERVWSKMYAEGDLQIHLSPDGIAAAHGVVSSRLRDMARFGMLYTPSWDKAASEPIVTPAIVQRIRQGVRSHDAFMRGFDGPVFTERLNDRIEGNSRQWDAVFADGDFYKSGLMGQGLYVSPDRDLVIAYFSVSPQASIHRYVRPIAKQFSKSL